MQKIPAMLILSVGFLLSACAREQEYDATNTYPVYQYEEVTLASALKEAPFDIDSSANGQRNDVGLIAMLAEAPSGGYMKMGQCTGFLVAPNIVATNSHCITDAVVNSSQCGKAFAIRFLDADSAGKTQYACKRVLKKSDLKVKALNAADWAFVEIEATTRTPHRIGRDGLPDRMAIRSVRVDPTGTGRIGGTVTGADCETAQNSVLNFDYTSPYATTALGIGCSSRQGNSGSPVFDRKSGEVIGILQAYATAEYLKVVGEILKPLGLSYPANPPAHFLFTNLSCVEDPSSDFPPNQNLCRLAKENVNKTPAIGKLDENLEKATKARAAEWEGNLPPFALYAIQFSSKNMRFTAMPSCLKPLAAWPAEILATKSEEGFFSKTQRYRAKVPFWLHLKLRTKLDPALRISDEIEVEGKTESRDIALEFGREKDPITADILDRYGFEKQVPLRHLGWCTDDELARGNTALKGD